MQPRSTVLAPIRFLRARVKQVAPNLRGKHVWHGVSFIVMSAILGLSPFWLGYLAMQSFDAGNPIDLVAKGQLGLTAVALAGAATYVASQERARTGFPLRAWVVLLWFVIVGTSIVGYVAGLVAPSIERVPDTGFIITMSVIAYVGALLLAGWVQLNDAILRDIEKVLQHEETLQEAFEDLRSQPANELKASIEDWIPEELEEAEEPEEPEDAPPADDLRTAIGDWEPGR